MNWRKEGQLLIGQYLKSSDLSITCSSNPSDYEDFMYGAFWPNLPWIYTQDLPAADTIRYFMKEFCGIDSKIEQFSNMECRYVVRGNYEQFKMFKETMVAKFGGYQI